MNQVSAAAYAHRTVMLGGQTDEPANLDEILEIEARLAEADNYGADDEGAK